MAGRRDPVMAELKEIRRRLSKRLHDAMQKGRLEAEVAQLEREGRRAYRHAVNGARNGRKHEK